MAEVFKNFTATATTSMADVYTCPASTQFLGTSITLVNIHATNSADATVVISDASNSNAEMELCKLFTIPAQSSLKISNDFVLEAGDKVRVIATAGSTIRVVGFGCEVS